VATPVLAYAIKLVGRAGFCIDQQGFPARSARFDSGLIVINKRVIPTAALVVFLIFVASVARADEGEFVGLNRRFTTDVRPFLKSYCLDCHGTALQEAKLDLSSYSTLKSVTDAHQTWEIVLERLAAKEMPPENSTQPGEQQRDAVIDWIRSARKFEATRNAGDPGPVLVRRLSNSEYNYSIRDLTGSDIRPTQTFPVDPANEAGFDNSGESLSMSPALVKKYLEAARLVIDHLVLKPEGIAFAPHPVVTDTDRDKYCVKRIVQFYERQPTDLEAYFFAAWKLQFSQKAGNGEIALSTLAESQNVSVRYLQEVWNLLHEQKAVGPVASLQLLWSQLPESISEEAGAHAGCVRMRDFVVGLREKLVPEVSRLSIEGVHTGSQTFVLWRNRQRATHRRTFDHDKLIAGSGESNSKTATGSEAESIDKDLMVPAGSEQRADFEAAFTKFCAVFPDAFYISERGRDYVEDSSKQDGEKGRLLSAGFHSMMGYFRDDRPLYELILSETEQRELDMLWQDLDFVASAPMRQYVGFLWFERTDSRYMRDPQFDFARPEDKAAMSDAMIRKLSDEYLQKAIKSGGDETGFQAIKEFFSEINDQIRWVESARLTAEQSHIDAVIEFASRAYRRRLTESEHDELKLFYKSLRDDDQLNHEEAIQDMIVSVLMSPFFCYRLDLAAANDQQRALTDMELASRLSYFLWSSLPDDELLTVAEAGELHRPEVLVNQAGRMLKDDRVRGLALEFGGNWLDYRRFEEHNAVDRERFPDFTDDLRLAMFEEPNRFLIDLIQQNRSVLEFLNADYTFANKVLAKHYGMADRFEHAGAGKDSNSGWVRIDGAGRYGRGGLLPMSVFLTKNAPGLRTSPVKRGYWVVRRLLGERIPPPPPNVPELPDDESKLGDLTLAETLARHRDHKSCAGCHDRFDAIGLAFEGFGPVGERREVDLGGRPVSTLAAFPGGDEGAGVNDLRKYLQQHRQEEFLDNLCRKLLSYALGRSLILSDDLLVQKMSANLLTNQYQFGRLVETIVTSPQFLNKRGRRLDVAE